MSFNARTSAMKHWRRLLILAGSLFLLAACRQEDTPLSTGQPTAVAETGASEASSPTEPAATPTETAVPPTPTPSEPLAATVNGAPLYLSDYEQELARYEQAEAQIDSADPGADYRDQVLQALIERMLIAQAADSAGISVTPAMVDDKLAELRSAAGGADSFNAWLEANRWTEDEFREALAAEMVAGQMRDQVTAGVPRAVEQVNARYLQVDDSALAQELWQRAKNGDDFAFLAQQNSLDRVTGENGGELGFFARGSLLAPAVEEAAFALQPGETSDVITVTGDDGRTTYYLVQVIARDPQRRLEPDMQYTLLQSAFEAWLADLWQQADIVLMVNTDS
ncbi:MAG: SurA N-terminal domain-containing protein [Anaerolineales bacterium]|nr:SurA N-terminal domain-containing protein [Anaerolineales bacterium]